MDTHTYQTQTLSVIILSISTLILSFTTFYAFYVSTFTPIDTHHFIDRVSTTVDSTTFSPIDNYLIDCGSTADSTINNRLFVSDSSHTKTKTKTLIPNSLYTTARVLKTTFNYDFVIRDKGTHMVRIHFQRLNSSLFVDCDFDQSKFHVLVNGYVVLTNFSGDYNKPVVKEYLIWVDSDKLVITFVPSYGSSFAFVNAIEVISAPKDLIVDTAQYLNGDKVEVFNGLAKQALETVYRINVGGPKVTPFNDSLWRTWVPDNGFLKSSNGSNRVYFSGRIKYEMGGASREVGPDNVYNTARVITSKNALVSDVNMTWEFPVIEGYKYLVRVHFCDIASISLGLLYFNVYVDGKLAYKDLDLSDVTNYMLASPFYADFVVDGDSSGVLSVSVGPSSKSMAYAVDGILNGMEVMKMNNSMGSLDGELCAGLVMNRWPRENIIFMFLLIMISSVAVVCLYQSVSEAMHRRTVGVKDYVAWSKLPVEASEVNLKHSNKQLPA